MLYYIRDLNEIYQVFMHVKSAYYNVDVKVGLYLLFVPNSDVIRLLYCCIWVGQCCRNRRLVQDEHFYCVQNFSLTDFVI